MRFRVGRSSVALLLLLFTTFIQIARASAGSEEQVSISSAVEPSVVQAGSKGVLKVGVTLSAGSHINSNQPDDPALIPTVFRPQPAAGITWAEVNYPEVQHVVEEYSTEPLSVYNGDMVFTVPFNVAASATPGRSVIAGELQVQVCDSEKCYPPQRLKTVATVEITGGGSTVGAAAGQSASGNAAGQAASTVRGKLNPGETVPDFEFIDFAGKARKFSEFRGKYVLLDFWATWCKPCLADIPHLKELYTKYRSNGFEILGMDAETLGQEDGDADPEFARETQERAKTIVSTRGATWTHATAATAVPVAVKIFSVESLPTKILVDPQSKVVAIIKEGENLDQLLSRLLSGAK